MFDNYELFQSPEAVIIAIGLIIFFIIYSLLLKPFKNKGPAILVAACISLISMWSLYTNDFYGWNIDVAVAFYLIAVVILIMLFYSFIKAIRRKR